MSAALQTQLIPTSNRRVQLCFSDGAEHAVEVHGDESVLAAAMRGGVNLLHQCMSGSCGTCVAKLIEGTLEMRSSTAHCLLPAELRDGQRLLCQSTPLTDARVRLDYPSALLTGEVAGRLTARVSLCEVIAPSVVRLVLELPESESLDFRAGQYVRVRVPGTDQWRSYSMASTAAELPNLELLIRTLSEGLMSGYLRERCAAGDEIEIDGPHGAFFLRASRSTHIMIAGGTGLAPIIAMLDELRRSSGRRPRIIVSFGCASPENLFYVEELQARADWMPNLEVRISVDRGGAAYTGLLGNPVQAISAADITAASNVAYLCGPSPMIEAGRAHLRSLGMKPESIYTEQFLPSAESPLVTAAAPVEAAAGRAE